MKTRLKVCHLANGLKTNKNKHNREKPSAVQYFKVQFAT